ncbi:MAG TPA: ABATE domain-containing protein [Chloroflexia bacterium]|nr:ABATE domain-containing protein [Chloroflexia bacterium]
MSETESYTFSDVGGALCLDFVNTVSSHLSEAPNEYMNSYDALLLWGRQKEVISERETAELAGQAKRRPEEAEAALQSALDLRRIIYRVFSAVATEQRVSEEDMQRFNSYLSNALSHVRVVEEEDGFAWGWAPLEGHLNRVLWPVVRSAADLLVSEQLGRVRECGGHDCGWLFVDLSKNHSRRWCSMSDCGNRAKVHRHYYRKQKAVIANQ